MSDQLQARVASSSEEMPFLVRVFAWSVFPVFFCGSIALAIKEMNRGVDPALAYIIPVVASYLLVMLLERILPLHRSWSRSQGDIHVDILYLIFSGAVTVQLLRPMMLALGVGLGGWLSQFFQGGPWPQDWPLLIQLILSLIVGEFFMYWAHRLGHVWEPLWRFHAVHHSAPRLYFLNAVRFHPVDLAISTFSPFIVLVALGADGRVLALYALVSAVHGIFQHANLPIRCGPLNWIFSMAELHRWHHSRSLEEANTNYGQNLIIWDIVFGTRFLPADREPPEDIGIAGMPDFPMGFIGQLISPITWARIQAENSGATTDETE